MLFEENYNKILVVDDDPDSRTILSEFIKVTGSHPICAQSGKQALDMFRAQPFPIVVTDMMMPVINGIVLLKEIKKLSPQTEVIIISGYDDIELAVESFRNQAADFIKKPVSLKTFELAVERAKEKITIKKDLLDYTENLEKLIAGKNIQLETLSKKDVDHSDLRTLLNSLPLVIFLIDSDFKVTALNNMYKQVFGDHTGHHCYQIDRDYDSPCEGCPAFSAFNDHSIVKAEIDYYDKEGHEKSTLVWASPVSDDSKEVMVICADVSMVKGINDNLSSLGLMIGSVSHGIKGMLTGLDGGVYVLDSALKKHDEQQAEKGLDMVRTVTARMKNMVLEILFHSKNRHLNKEGINAGSFMNDIVKIMDLTTKADGILLYQHLNADDFMFRADASVLTPALINVLENAIEACSVDNNKNKPEIHFSMAHDVDHVKIEISDNGVGIDQAEIGTIFRLFQSGKGLKGTGLGLFITEKAVRQHGGTIRVESNKGVGTKFIITLPVK